MKIEVKHAENGYTTVVDGVLRIHDTLKDVVESIGADLLMNFEGKARTFYGKSYGEIVVKILEE